jgi:aldehyde dehydrogenase (NAD+)
VASPAWKLAPALLAGNTVVLKPASQAPALAMELARVLAEAGLPAGVLNVITGEGRSFGAAVAAHPSVKAVSFTGSYAVGYGLYQAVAPRMVRTQLEMGGKNPTIVLADADLDLAVNLVARAGFGLTGQACTATSRVIVDQSVAEAFTEKLVAKAKSWKVGPGLTAGTDIGAVVSESQLNGNLEYVAIAESEGARIVSGGKRLLEGDLAHGLFMEPTVIDRVRPTMRIAQEEVFGPVVAVISVHGFDEALTVANGLEVGLSASLVTRDFKRALEYVDRIEAGVVKVNQISTGLALQAPFGGVKQSSTDTFREQGAGALEFYTRTKTVYLDYSV